MGDRDPFEATLEIRDVGDAAQITFLIPQIESAAQAGGGNDPRRLGIASVAHRHAAERHNQENVTW